MRRRSIAYSKTECRKVITLRTVFGARPRLSIAVANASTWAVLTSVNGLLPSRGEMCTRCIDSQPSRYERLEPRSRKLWRSESVT
jgi:hypothetical protein